MHLRAARLLHLETQIKLIILRRHVRKIVSVEVQTDR